MAAVCVQSADVAGKRKFVNIAKHMEDRMSVTSDLAKALDNAYEDKSLKGDLGRLTGGPSRGD
jgi:hypothetical protein